MLSHLELFTHCVQKLLLFQFGYYVFVHSLLLASCGALLKVIIVVKRAMECLVTVSMEQHGIAFNAATSFFWRTHIGLLSTLSQLVIVFHIRSYPLVESFMCNHLRMQVESFYQFCCDEEQRGLDGLEEEMDEVTISYF